MWCQNRRPLERKTKSFVTYEGTFSIIFPTEWQQKGLSASIMKLAQCGVSFLVIQGQECLKKARNKLVPGVQNRRVISRCLLLRVPADKSYLQCMKENIKKKSPRGHFELLCWDVCESCFSWRTLLRCTVSVFRAVGGLIKKRKKVSFLCPQLEFPIIIPVTDGPWRSRAFSTLSPYCLSHSHQGSVRSKSLSQGYLATKKLRFSPSSATNNVIVPHISL